ncbi:NADPH:quinone oxidoreductase 2 [Devosia sp. LC5]|uniref:SDR family oxidoreductase n=1 Tax=Devosia sp. LC5 TaxID=1502724 RepID=UPI0004E31E3E|nr:NAD(P)H-binding protein [Devosia sp. LC5]KFC72442.1 NADPH:quinone oxidoreductase 2 [Devosia sp. LC5]
MTSPILVIGATGKVGSRIVAKLEAQSRPVRGASRRSTPAFDWEDDATWSPALAGAEAVFVAFMPDLAARGAPEAIAKFAEKAIAAGVKQVVLLSGRGEDNALRSEAIIQASGLGYTIVRASWFNQNFSDGVFLPAVLEGFISLPAGNRKEPFIDVDDIADVAVAALTDQRHLGQLYDVTGPRLMTFAEAAAEISAAAGHPVTYAHIALPDFHAALVPEVGAPTADFLRDLCEEVFDGRNESLSNGVQRALGRQPRDFADYCTAMAATGIWKRAA